MYVFIVITNKSNHKLHDMSYDWCLQNKLLWTSYAAYFNTEG